MSRLFEMNRSEANAEVRTIVDLDKVCGVVVSKPKGHLYSSIKIRFVDGHEASDMVPPEVVDEFLDAFRAYLK